MLASKGLLLRVGTAVDATLIAAPTATKNKGKARDPDMHSSKKGNQWYFGMKPRIGVDADSGLAHTVKGTAQAMSTTSPRATAVLHGPRSRWSLRTPVTKVLTSRADAKPEVQWHVAMRCGQAQSIR